MILVVETRYLVLICSIKLALLSTHYIIISIYIIEAAEKEATMFVNVG